jgi:hypothetical protein
VTLFVSANRCTEGGASPIRDSPERRLGTIPSRNNPPPLAERDCVLEYREKRRDIGRDHF